MIFLLAIIYFAVSFILNNVLQTAVGDLLMTINFIAFVVVMIGSVYYISKFSVKQFVYNLKNRID